MKIKKEHFDWWESLSELWKKIFLVSIYHSEKHTFEIEENGYDIYNKPADHLFYLNYPIKEKISEQELERIFHLTHILYDGYDINPERYAVVDYIPPLHYFENLAYLSLSHNYVSDLNGLQGVKTLKYLCLHENSITDSKQLKYISEIKSLKYLDLSVNNIKDFSFLRKLVDLKELFIWGQWDLAPINITGFENLVSLTHLNLDAPIDMAPLFSLNQLEELYVGSDEYDFDCSKIESLINTLSNTYVSYYLPHPIWVKDMSDSSFLWNILLEPDFISHKDFDKNRLLLLQAKANHLGDNAFKELVNRAVTLCT